MKTAEKRQPTPEPPAGPTRDEIQTAYEVHTLAQMLYGQLVSSYDPGMTYAGPVRGIGQPNAPQARYWGPPPMTWGYPPHWGM